MHNVGEIFLPYTFWLIISTVILILFALFYLKSNKKYPPGPKGYPIIGNAFVFRGGNIQVKIPNLTKQYKGVYRLSVFGQNIIILGNYEVMKEAFINQGTIFSGRPQNIYMFKYWHRDKGILFSEGKLWQKQQCFGFSTLRNFGMGKRLIEDIILQETSIMLSHIDNQNGRSFNTADIFTYGVSNVILKMVVNRRLDYEDEFFSCLINNVNVINKAFRLENTVNILPILRYIQPEFKVFTKAISDIRIFLNDAIDDHIKHYNEENINDYIDAYLQRMKDEEKNIAEMSNFTREQLIYSIEDLFLGGTDSIPITLKWMVLFMLHFPNIQKKIQAEIDTVVGTGRMPSWDDKVKLPYTEATILEVQRLANVAYFGFPHKALEDGQIAGYEIPKGSILIADMTSIHYDPMYWPEPKKFDPTRFLDEEGNVKIGVKSFAPFSIGARTCIGENLAKMELFIIFSSLLQNFTLMSPPGEEPPDFLFRTDAIISVPLPFNVCATPRSF